MNAASFKDLCMDAGDALAQARFWASVLGSRLVDLGDGSARLDPAPGRPNRETIWIDPVPEPRTVKTRVHVDLRLPGADPAAILQAGATVVREPGEDPWWVLADPEGNEFCAFPQRPDNPTPPGIFELIVDSHDPWAQVSWWAGVTGGNVQRPDEGTFAWVEGAAGFPWQYWVFTQVPDGTRRWHVPSRAGTPASRAAPRARPTPSGPCPRGTARGLRWAGSSTAAPPASGSPARRPGRLVSTTTRGDSTPRGPHSARLRRRGRSGAASAGAPRQAARSAAHCLTAARVRRCGARRCEKARGRSRLEVRRQCVAGSAAFLPDRRRTAVGQRPGRLPDPAPLGRLRPHRRAQLTLRGRPQGPVPAQLLLGPQPRDRGDHPVMERPRALALGRDQRLAVADHDARPAGHRPVAATRHRGEGAAQHHGYGGDPLHHAQL